MLGLGVGLVTMGASTFLPLHSYTQASSQPLPNDTEQQTQTQPPSALSSSSAPSSQDLPSVSEFTLAQVVSGHGGMLQHGDLLLKPMLAGPRGVAEKDFYEAVGTSKASHFVHSVPGYVC